MTRVYVRRYQIPWVPSVVAAHTRVQIGRYEHYFVRDQPPATVPASKSPKLVASVKMGSICPERAAAVLTAVNAHFVEGSYHVIFRNCVVYSYVLCCSLFGEELVAAAFPTDANQLVHAARGWGDFLRPIRAAQWEREWPRLVERARLQWAVGGLAEAAVPHAD
jgi:hypothetical protein